MLDLSQYPGRGLVAKGLEDLEQGNLSEESLLVLVGRSRLERLGFQIPEIALDQPYEQCLFEALETRMPRGAHSAYDALLRRLSSFANTYSMLNRP